MGKASQNNKKEIFYNEVWERNKDIPVDELWEVYKHTLISQYRHYNSALLLFKANDIYSGFNSFFLSTEEGCKAFFIHQFLSARFNNIEIPKDIFKFAFSKFFEHKEKWAHSIQMLITRFENHIESYQNEIKLQANFYTKIKNGTSNRWKQKYKKEIEEFNWDVHSSYIARFKELIWFLKKNDYFHLKNKSIYVDYSTKTHSFGFPENYINKAIFIQMKNISGAMGEISIQLLIFNNQKALQIGLIPIDHKKFDLDYKYQDFLKKN